MREKLVLFKVGTSNCYQTNTSDNTSVSYFVKSSCRLFCYVYIVYTITYTLRHALPDAQCFYNRFIRGTVKVGQPRRGNNSFAMMCTLISWLKAPEILKGRKEHTSFIAGQFYASRFKGHPGHSYGTKRTLPRSLF